MGSPFHDVFGVINKFRRLSLGKEKMCLSNVMSGVVIISHVYACDYQNFSKFPVHRSWLYLYSYCISFKGHE